MVWCRGLVVGALFFIVQIEAAYACSFVIAVKKHAIVSGPEIKLIDLVDIAETTLKDTSSLDYAIYDSPSVSSSHRWKRSVVSHWFKQWPAQCVILPDEISVSRKSHSISSSEIKQIVKEHLIKELGASYSENVTIRFATELEGIRIPAGKPVEMEVSRILPTLPNDQVSVWVDLVRDQQVVRSINVRVAISYMQEVWKVNKRIEIGKPFQKGHLEPEWLDNAKGHYIDTQTAVFEYVANRTLSSGERLRKTDIRPADAIVSGQWYFANVSVGQVTVQVKIQALAYANEGDVFPAIRKNGKAVNIYLDDEGRLWVK